MDRFLQIFLYLLGLKISPNISLFVGIENEGWK